MWTRVVYPLVLDGKVRFAHAINTVAAAAGRAFKLEPCWTFEGEETQRGLGACWATIIADGAAAGVQPLSKLRCSLADVIEQRQAAQGLE